MSKPASIGIDIGGTKTLCALLDSRFRVVEEVKVKTRVGKGKGTFTEALTDSVRALMRKARKRQMDVARVGVGCAGHLDARGVTFEVAPNLPFLEGYPLASRLKKLTGVPVTLVNDVHAGLYGEQQLGVAAGCKHVVGIFLGTGVGGALIIDGRPLLGAGGWAGNIGHYLVEPLGAQPGSDRHGVLDDLLGRTAIAGVAASLAARQQAPRLREIAGTDVEHIHSGELAEAVAKRDTAIEDLMRSRANILGIALSNMVDFLNPEMIVLGGGLTEAMPELIRSQVEAAIQAHAAPGAREGLRVEVARLGKHAVVVGAAKWALDHPLGEEHP